MSETLTHSTAEDFSPVTIPEEIIDLTEDLRFIKVLKRDKRPAEAGWESVANYTPDDPRLLRWLQDGNNYGYFTRDGSDLCVLDADKPEELHDLIRFLGKTLTIRSGREGNGYHILFRCRDLSDKKLYLKNSAGLEIGDIRPGGTSRKYQCVGPNSIHPDTGKKYLISDSSSPRKINRAGLMTVLSKYLVGIESNESIDNPWRGKEKISRRRQPEGGRDDYLVSWAGKFRREGMDYPDILRELMKINLEDCDPPKEAQEIDRIARSSMKWPPEERQSPSPRQDSVNKTHISGKNIQGQSEKSRRQIVITDERIRDLTDQALESIYEVNKVPFLFRRTGGLCRISSTGNGSHSIASINETSMRSILERVCDFDRAIRSGDDIGYKPAYAPKALVQDLLEFDEINVPYLKGLAETPILTRDNTLICNQGYDPVTKLFYAPSDELNLPPIPDNPNPADVARAVDLISDVFCDFPLVGESDRANLYGCLLTAVLRPMIRGVTPLFLADKSQMGSGGSLICEIIDIVATGSNTDLTGVPKKEEDFPKKITGLLQAGKTVIVLDNIEGKLESPALAIALSSETWTERLLGKNEIAEYPNTATWLGNGNNIQLGLDLPRRCYRCRIQYQDAKPWQRSGFKHPNIKAYVRENRSLIIAACLIMARSWLSAGSPGPKTVPYMGGFEDWRYTIGGILEHCKIPAFLGNLDQLYEDSSGDNLQWESFLETWHYTWGSNPVTTSDIAKYVEQELSSGPDRPLYESLPDDLQTAYHRRTFTRALGNRLKRMCDAVLTNGYHVTRGGLKHHAIEWLVQTPPENQIPLVTDSGDLVLTWKQTPLTPQTPLMDRFNRSNSENLGSCLEPCENTHSPNSHSKNPLDFQNTEETHYKGVRESLTQSLEENEEKEVLGTKRDSAVSVLPSLPTPPPFGMVDFQVSEIAKPESSNTTKYEQQPNTGRSRSPTVEEWFSSHQTPSLPPPDDYGFVHGSPGTKKCICTGCKSMPLRTTKSGLFPLCQKHFDEYRELWDKGVRTKEGEK